MAEGGSGSKGPSFKLRTARMEAFSDGVYAIAITLLVIELVVPAASNEPLRNLLHEWPQFLAYVVSFASIGSSWIAHSTITEYLERADSTLLRLNLLVLFAVSLIPFPTRMIGEYAGSVSSERVAVTAYGLNLLAMAVFTSVLWHHAVSEGLIKGDAAVADLREVTRKLTPSFAFYLVAIGIGLLNPKLAVGLFLVIALFLLIPLRSIIRHAHHPPPEP
jgi:uncharacterized membrane protein